MTGKKRTGICFLSVTALFVSGCAVTEHVPPALRADFVQAGRIERADEIRVFEIGDIEEIWTEYSLVVDNKPTQVIDFISSGQNCWISDKAAQHYLVILNKSYVYRIEPGASKPQSTKTPVYVASLCLAIDESIASKVQKYSPLNAK